MILQVSILLSLCFVPLLAQPLPSQCAYIIFQGSASPYAGTSAAAAFQTFCSVKDQMSQCIEENKAALISGRSPVDWAIGLTFSKSAFDKKVTEICNSLADVANDLECLKTNSNVDCENILPSNTNFLLDAKDQFTAGLVSETEAKQAICGVMTLQSECWKTMLKGCSPKSVEFMANYYDMFASNCLPALPPGFADSMFLSCGMEIFDGVARDLELLQFADFNFTIDFILNFTLSQVDKVCSKADEFGQCIVERSYNTTSVVDQIIMEIVNISHVKDALKLTCNSVEDLSSVTECLPDVAYQAAFCAGVYFNMSLEEQSSTTEAPDLNKYKSTYCPRINALVDCVSIPLSRCSQGFATKIESIVETVLAETCKSKEDVPEVNIVPYGSVFVQCGTGMFSQIGEDLGQMFESQNIDVKATGSRLLDAMCRNSQWYFSCVEQRLPSSNNFIDKVIKEVINDAGETNLASAAADICYNRLQAIKENIDCMASKGSYNKTSNSLYCNGQEMTIMNLLSNAAEIVNMNGGNIRSTFCTPIGDDLSCAKTLFGSCSSALEPLFDSIPKSLLRPDCGGNLVALTTTALPAETGSTLGNKVNTERLSSSASRYGLNMVFVGLAFILGFFSLYF